MCNEAVGDENLMGRLPLPIAQLYRRAHNAKSSLERHQAACYLWEASLKLLASVAIAESWHAGFQKQAGELLKDLVRPSLGHWWKFVRGLVPLLAGSGDRPFQEVCSLLDSSRDDLPRAAGLDALLLEVLQLGGGERSTVRLSELFDRLAGYCDGEREHGADRQRSFEFYDRLGGTLLSGVGEILLRLDFLAGRCLLYIDDVRRQESGDWLVERYHLIGESSRRIESQVIPGPDGVRLPRPRRLYLSLSTDS